MVFKMCISSYVLRVCNQMSDIDCSLEMEEAILDLTENRYKKCETCF